MPEQPDFLWFDNLPNLVGQIQPESILSRTLWKNEHVKAVLFSFDAGQSLSEHSAAQPAILHVISGQARITLGDDEKQTAGGAWAYMAPGLKHGVYAETPVILLLFLLQKEK